MGRPLGYREMFTIHRAETIIAAYQQRQGAEDWTAWARDNPNIAALLNEAMRLANGEEN